MSPGRKFVWVTIFFLVVAAVNLFARKGLNYSYAELIAYNKLYYSDQTLRVTKLVAGPGDSLHVFFQGPGVRKNNIFELYTRGSLFLRETASHLTIKPPVGRAGFFLRLNGMKDSLPITIGYTPPEVYRKWGNSSGLAYEFRSSALPVIDYPLYGVTAWQLQEDISGSMIKSYLADSMHIKPGDNSAAKVLKIAAYILKLTKGMEGTPADALSRLDPIGQLNLIRNGKGKIWCGNYASIFSKFACAAGVPVRLVDCGKERRTISTGIHVFNEVYLRESNCWAYTDLMSKNVFVRNKDSYLNTVDLQRLLRYNIRDSNIVADCFKGDSIIQVPFANVCGIESYYFTPAQSFRFFYGDFVKRMVPRNAAERLLKFFYTRPYYAIYSDNVNTPRYEFYFRVGTNYLLAAAFILWLLTIVNLPLSRFRSHNIR